LWVAFAAAKIRLERLLFDVECSEAAGLDGQEKCVKDFLDRYDRIVEEAFVTWMEATMPPHGGADNRDQGAGHEPSARRADDAVPDARAGA
jgi:hypothetical protein